MVELTKGESTNRRKRGELRHPLPMVVA